MCPLEAMLLGAGEPESWLMDCSPPPAAWELPPPPGEEMEGELGSLEEVGAAFAEPSSAASSLGSWADECERADAALAAAEAQMGRGCPEESLEGDTALAGDLLGEEDCEWVAALGAAMAPLPPRLEGARGRPPGRKGAPQPIQGPPPAKGDQRKPGPAPGKGAVAPKAGEAAAQGAPTGKKPHCPSSPRDPDEDEIQVVKVQQGGLTLPTRVKERPYEWDDQRREAVPLVAGEGRMVDKKLTAGAYGVPKIFEFRKPKGRGPAQVEARWETVAAPPSGPELQRIMKATAEADWPQDVRVTLGERVAEIRKLGEAQGD